MGMDFEHFAGHVLKAEDVVGDLMRFARLDRPTLTELVAGLVGDGLGPLNANCTRSAPLPPKDVLARLLLVGALVTLPQAMPAPPTGRKSAPVPDDLTAGLGRITAELRKTGAVRSLCSDVCAEGVVGRMVAALATAAGIKPGEYEVRWLDPDGQYDGLDQDLHGTTVVLFSKEKMCDKFRKHLGTEAGEGYQEWTLATW